MKQKNFLTAALITLLLPEWAAAGLISFQATPITCPDMAPEAKKVDDCKTLSSRTFPVICEAPYSYTSRYNSGIQDWKERKGIKDHIPEYRVYTLSVPGKAVYHDPRFMGKNASKYDPRLTKLQGGKVSEAHLVNVYVDPNTGRIVKFTTQHRSPAESTGTPVVSYDDPRLKSMSDNGEYKQRMSPSLKGKDFEEQGRDYERQLNHWLMAARSKGCGFVKDHERSLVYAQDPQQKDIDHFFNSCKEKGEFPCCIQESAAPLPGLCQIDPKGAAEGGNIADIKAVISATTNDFNLDMIAKLREGFLTAQAGLIATTDPGVQEIQSFKIGPSEDGSGRCNSAMDGGREERFQSSKGQLNKILGVAQDPEFIKARKDAEWNYNRQTVMDAIEVQWAQCLNKHWAIAGGSPEAQEHYYNVVNRNRMLGLIGEGGRYDIYKVVKKKLQESKLDDGFDWSSIEDRVNCAKPETLWNWKQLVKKIGGAEPVDSDTRRPKSKEFDLIMDPAGITQVIRNKKVKALEELKEEIDSSSEDCAKAGSEYVPRYIRKNKGLNLWKNQALVAEVVRDYALAGRKDELERFNYIYCQNKDAQAGHDKWKGRIMVGLTVAAMVLPFAPAVLPVSAGSVLLLATGMTATATLTRGAMDLRGLMNKYDEAELAKMTYDAQIESAQKMDQTRNTFYLGLISSAVSAALSGIDIYQFAKVGGQALRAGKLLSHKEQGFYDIVAQAMKAGKVSKEQLRSLMASCVNGNCDNAVEQLAALYAKSAKATP